MTPPRGAVRAIPCPSQLPAAFQGTGRALTGQNHCQTEGLRPHSRLLSNLLAPSAPVLTAAPHRGQHALTVAVLALFQGLAEALAQGQVLLVGSALQELLHLVVARPVRGLRLHSGLLPGLLRAGATR